MNEENPLVSVVTVVYNDVAHIEQTILSVLNQTYKNIEYIIIDGGSTDGTVDIIKKYADRLGFWVSEKDKGIFDAMNKGIEHARGEYLNFINSGDYFVPPYTVFTEIFSKTHTADVLYGSFIGNFNGRSVLCKAPDSATERAWQGMQVCHSTLFIKLNILQKFKFNLEYRVSGDTELVARCVAENCSFEKLDQVIFRVGTLGNSADHWLKARLENWKIAQKYFGSLRTNWYHFYHLAHEAIFRTLKKLFSLVGLYQLVRFIYRKKIQSKIPLLPSNCVPFEEKV